MSDSSAMPATTNAVRERYEERLVQFRADMAQLGSRSRLLAHLRLLTFVLGVGVVV